MASEQATEKAKRKQPGSPKFTLQDVPRYECIKAFVERFPELDPSAIESCLMLLKVGSDVFDAFQAHFQRHDVSRGRFVVLMLLFRYGEEALSPTELAERAGVTRATMTGLLDGLEGAGLVQREPQPEDRRRVVVHLTATGREFLQEMLPDHFRRVAGLMRHLDESERRQLVHLLEKVTAGIPAVRDA